MLRRFWHWLIGTREVEPARKRRETHAYYRGEISECPECGGDHESVIAYELADARNGFNFAMICPTNGNEILVAIEDENE